MCPVLLTVVKEGSKRILLVSKDVIVLVIAVAVLTSVAFSMAYVFTRELFAIPM